MRRDRALLAAALLKPKEKKKAGAKTGGGCGTDLLYDSTFAAL